MDWFMTSCFHNSWLGEGKSYHSCINCWACRWHRCISHSDERRQRRRGDWETGLHLNFFVSFPYCVYINTHSGWSYKRKKARKQSMMHNGDGKRKTGHDKGDRTERQWKQESDLGVKGNRENAEWRAEKMMTTCMYVCVYICVCVWRVLRCESALSYGAFGRPLLCLQLGWSVPLVCSSPCHPLPLAKTLSCFITTTTAVPAAAGGGNSLWRLTLKRVCGKEISQQCDILLHILTYFILCMTCDWVWVSTKIALNSLCLSVKVYLCKRRTEICVCVCVCQCKSCPSNVLWGMIIRVYKNVGADLSCKEATLLRLHSKSSWIIWTQINSLKRK